MREYGGDEIPTLTGTPLKGERLGDKLFDGTEQAAIFPGDLPGDPSLALEHGRAIASNSEELEMRFIRFRPPNLGAGGSTHGRVIPTLQNMAAMKFRHLRARRSKASGLVTRCLTGWNRRQYFQEIYRVIRHLRWSMVVLSLPIQKSWKR